MPTGYTAPIHDGTPEFGLREYATQCAHAFGAFAHLRDSSLGAPLDDPPPPNSYYQDSLKKTQKELAAFEAMTPDECTALMEKDFQRQLEVWETTQARRKDLRARYESMIQKVEAWEVDETYAELKKFMLSQLTESVRFDVGDDDRPYNVRPVRQTLDDFHRTRLADLRYSVNYDQEQIQKENARHQERMTWIQGFRKLLSEIKG